MRTNNDGHRSRLRKKYLNNGMEGFLDYEIIELLLTIGIPRKDCKPIAKGLISKYRTVSGVINAPEAELIKIDGLGPASIIGLKLAKDLATYQSREAIQTSNTTLLNTEKVAKYLMAKIGHSKKEIFKIICCNTQGTIVDETVSIGTLDASILHPREVFKIAIDNSASHIIISHNHPSGDTNPSDEDIYTTRRLIEAGKIIGIDISDHLIVSSTNYISLKQNGFL